MNDVGRGTDAQSHVLQIARMGRSAGVLFPEELLSRLRLKEGDQLRVIEEPYGTLRLSRVDSDDDQTMEIAERVMVEYRDTLKALAK